MGFDVAADRKDKALAAKRKAQQEKLRAGIDGFKEGYKTHGSHVCTQCGEQGKPKRIVKGNIFFEIILWLCFLLPGLLYSIWRHASQFRGCPYCKTQTMVRKDSPLGKKLVA